MSQHVERECMICGSVGAWNHMFLCDSCMEVAVKDAFRNGRMKKLRAEMHCERCGGCEELKFRDYYYSCRDDGCTRKGWELDPAALAGLMPVLDQEEVIEEAARLNVLHAQLKGEAASLKARCIDLERARDDASNKLTGAQEMLRLEREAKQRVEAALRNEKTTSRVLRQELGLIRNADVSSEDET